MGLAVTREQVAQRLYATHLALWEPERTKGPPGPLALLLFTLDV
jgi:hypothetical protein